MSKKLEAKGVNLRSRRMSVGGWYKSPALCRLCHFSCPKSREVRGIDRVDWLPAKQFVYEPPADFYRRFG